MEGVTIRPASSNDKQKVLSMRDVYGKSDYLPAYYDWFMDRGNCFPYVAEMDEEIVGFVAISLVDGGETMFERAGRVSLRMEGRGLYKHMLQQIEKQLLMSVKVGRTAQCIRNDNTRVKMSSFLQRHSLIMTRVVRSFLVEPNTLPLKLKSCQTAARFMDENEFKIFYSQLSDDEISYLFPERRILVNSVTFRLQTSNFSIMNGPNTVYLEDVSGRSGEVSGLLSVCTQYLIQKLSWLSVRIDVHGTDTTSLASHLSNHMQRAMQTSTGKTQFVIYTEPKISDENIDKSLNVLGIERDLSLPYHGPSSSHGYNVLMVYESRQ